MAIRLLALIVLFLSACGGQRLWDPDDIPNVIPRNLSWANIDTDGDGVFEDYVSSIKLQPCSDCYIYGATGIIESQFKIDHGLELAINVSEQNIHNCMKLECDRGGDPYYVFDFIHKYGIQQEMDSPTGDWGQCGNCDREDRQYIAFEEWGSIYGQDPSYEEKKQAIVNALQRGPVAIVVDSWFGYRKGVDYYTRYCTERDPSGHFVSIVGYRNYGELMLVKNSHGESDLLEMIFDGGDTCGFASSAYQVYNTYLDWNIGESYCYSADDKDNDGIPNAQDNCPWNHNPEQENQDFDIFGDVCDPCPEDGWLGRFC